ncbi:junctional adhesion molecule 3B isoform X3 [Latimeria chalumnae]|uniref:junctional adhesion molecule 3B isoform X3 n=1 Tax=Latimeria chalumnae TaxID=7897 RepID=UPI00313C180A
MALRWLTMLFVLLWHSSSIFAVELQTLKKDPIVGEFNEIELSCIIKSIHTPNPRIEWKKIRRGETTHVYYNGAFMGPLQNRAKISGAASILIMNTTRTDSGTYRCEVVAPMDSKTLDEISIELIVQVKPVTPSCVVPKAVPVGKSASLHCTEDEGYPLPTYRWYKDNQILPLDPKTSVDFANSTYSLDQKTGTLSFSAVSKKDKGTYHCEAENLAGSAKCEAQLMDVYDINIAGIIGGVMVVILVLVLITSGICCAYKRGYFANKEKKGKNYKAPVKADGMDYVRTDDEGDFRHKSSFVI